MNLISELSFVKRAKNRSKVLKAVDGNIMPSELVLKLYGKSSNTYFNIVSRALGELVQQKLVKIVNPKSKTGRLYTLTDKGKRVVSMLGK